MEHKREETLGDLSWAHTIFSACYTNQKSRACLPLAGECPSEGGRRAAGHPVPPITLRQAGYRQRSSQLH